MDVVLMIVFAVLPWIAAWATEAAEKTRMRYEPAVVRLAVR